MLKKIIEGKSNIIQFSKYIIIGGTSALCELMLFTIFQIIGMSIFISNISSVIISTIINYLLNKFWAFKSQTRSIKSLVLYIGLFIFNITFSSQFIVILSNVGVKSIVAKFISMILITCWNFILYKKVVFKE
ncbi:GtrA family protein [Clostridium sp. NSJ-49]|uniref:GtrA family protein n=1 Tax=Clostridium TaxID=1485 RepID=UPI00164CCF4B|nr:GtrA family protein [Clostridium sp. NSJ-49]MBC5625936.1 GtrA family protein [Clostridium sp. NSJ-49]